MDQQSIDEVIKCDKLVREYLDKITYSKEEVRELFLNELHDLVNKRFGEIGLKNTDGDLLVFSILSLIDGSAVGFPGFTLKVATEVSETDYASEMLSHSENDKYFPPHVINDDCELHALYANKFLKGD